MITASLQILVQRCQTFRFIIGGVGVLIHEGFNEGSNEGSNQRPAFRSFDYIDLTLKSSGSTDLRLIVIYRPPSCGKTKTPIGTFIEEFSTLVELLCTNHQKLLILGDFNLHIDVSTTANVLQFLNILDAGNLCNHVNHPTESSGHTLDLIISRNSDDLVLPPSIDSSLPSDHRAVLCGLTICRPSPVKRIALLRNYRDTVIQEFQEDLKKSRLLTKSTCMKEPLACDELADLYNTEMRRLLDQHAPLEEKEFILRPKTPWSSHLNEFEMVSEDEIMKFVKRSSNAYCELDPVPTSLLKNITDCLAPVLAQIVNTSLESGVVPTSMKQAIVKPRLKKESISRDNLSNYRPVANLSFVGKLLERAAATQIKDYLAENNLLPVGQSAYRENFSVETALLKVQNDILMALDTRKEVVLLLLDFSAAFDTIDHQLLLQRMSTYFGIRGSVLRWFSSYVENRSHAVKIDNATSGLSHDEQGVPQGSVIGPLTFTLYTAPINDIIRYHGVDVMLYADDT
nr:uncharacterized protein LOC129280870 [Lytechinus pictus]